MLAEERVYDRVLVAPRSGRDDAGRVAGPALAMQRVSPVVEEQCSGVQPAIFVD